jgi:site-specific DNA-cytosine methylase
MREEMSASGPCAAIPAAYERISSQDCQRGPLAGYAVLDLCCGLGGLSLAARELGGTVVAGVDLSDCGLETFRHNFTGAKGIQADISQKRIWKECLGFAEDRNAAKGLIVVSGPPCQGFSVAGPRAKVDPRNRVLLAVARAVAWMKPEGALFENVAALLAKRHAGYLKRFKKCLTSAGYCLHTVEADACDYGVPQRRRRMLCFAPVCGNWLARTSFSLSGRAPADATVTVSGTTAAGRWESVTIS